MASGDPFILYIPNGTAIPYSYQPAASVTICITSMSGIGCNSSTTQNAGTNYTLNAIASAQSTASYLWNRVFIDNTSYLHINDVDLTNYGTQITGIEF